MDIVWDLPLSSEGIEVSLDGHQPLLVRPIRANDADALAAGFANLSPRSRYLRFFSLRDELGDKMIKDFTDIDHDLHRAWVVADPEHPRANDGDGGHGIAVARLFRDADDPTVAEATVVVTDEYQQRGVGTLLLNLLTSTAAATGVTRIRFETLWENNGLRRLMGKLNATVDKDRSEGEVIVYELPVGDEDVTAGALYEVLRWIADSTEKPEDLAST